MSPHSDDASTRPTSSHPDAGDSPSLKTSRAGAMSPQTSTPHRHTPADPRTLLSSVFTGSAVARLVIGWAAVILAAAFGVGNSGVGSAQLTATLALLVAVISYCAFGVVEQAEHLARRLGDPYGTLILTLSIVIIEVVLISAVMFGPGESATIARDSVMAVSMVIMNLVVGLALLLGAMRHGSLRLNSAGSSTYIAMLIVLLTLGLVLPGFIGTEGSYSSGHQVVVILMTIAVYGFFLLRQTTTEADDYREPHLLISTHTGLEEPDDDADPSVLTIIAEHRAEVLVRSLVLVVTVLPIVLLSHDMASLVDEALVRVDAPVALAGLLIAMIVFLPESITALRAGLLGEAQRVMNLCHGALVSTVGLTIPGVLIIGAVTGQTVVLAESPAHILLLVVSVLLAMNTVLARRISAGHGAVHLVVFVAYGMTLFS